MLDFGVLPPEITSAQMYSGPGSGPLMVAASAWDTLAAHGSSFAQGYSSALSALEGQHWAGPAAAAMAAAAAPYVQWAASTAVKAERAASQLRAAAAAFEAAHAAVVPPPLVAANRAQRAHLIATNVFGQHTAQIAAVGAAYQGMWAQNTHAMYSYAGSASSTTKLSLFSQAPQTTNPAGQSAAPAAAAAAAGGSQSQNLLTELLQGLSTPGSAASSSAVTSLTSDVGTFNTLSGPTSFVLGEMRTVGNVGSFAVALGRVFADGALYAPLTGVLGGLPSELGAMAALPAAGLTAAVGPSSTGVLASAASADAVGQLSVPKAWAGATPVASFTAAEEPMWLWEAESAAGHPAGLTAASLPAGIPTEGMAAAAGMMIGRASVSNALKVPPRRFKMSRPKSGG